MHKNTQTPKDYKIDKKRLHYNYELPISSLHLQPHKVKETEDFTWSVYFFAQIRTNIIN